MHGTTYGKLPPAPRQSSKDELPCLIEEAPADGRGTRHSAARTTAPADTAEDAPRAASAGAAIHTAAIGQGAPPPATKSLDPHPGRRCLQRVYEIGASETKQHYMPLPPPNNMAAWQ